MVKLSVVIITMNEEKNMARCLASVKDVADEIIVLDSYSTDATEAICMQYDVKFHQQKFAGYIEQKNDALKLATHPYLLSLDADEALSERLTQSIMQVKNNWQYDAYHFNRLTNFCGRWIRHCGWYPDKKTRLFKAGSGKWAGDNPHDKFEAEENKSLAYLKGDLLHYSYYEVHEYLLQIEKFSTIAAHTLFKKGVQSSLFKIVYKSGFKFVRDYFLKLGFMDGRFGFIISKYGAYGVYLKYKKLRQLGKKRN